jgi:hypothetical protein
MLRSALSAVLAVCAAVPAHAEPCPATTADAARGIAVSYDDGSTSHTVLDPATGDTVETFRYPDGFAFRNDLVLSLISVRLVDISADGTENPQAVSTYTYTPARPERLEPGTQWTASYRFVSATDAVEGQFLLSVWAETSVTIGGCTFRAFPVTTLGRDAEFAFLSQIDYLPDLGISLIRGYGELFADAVSVTPLTIAIADQP